jgi:two-component system, NarL family, nitrate/nitrite response regulator NarL
VITSVRKGTDIGAGLAGVLVDKAAASDLGRVLVVDDDAEFRTLVSKLLVHARLASEEVAGVEAALEAARRERPALVVLDVSLSDLSGYEVCRELRDEFGEELPIILVSGERVEPVDRAVGLLIGADDYMVKPFDADEFLARVRRLVTRSEPVRDRVVTTSRELRLTKRELEVLRLLAGGRRASEIATELVISKKTVASHIQNVLAKLRVHSRAQAVAWAFESGLMAPADARQATTTPRQ